MAGSHVRAGAAGTVATAHLISSSSARREVRDESDRDRGIGFAAPRRDQDDTGACLKRLCIQMTRVLAAAATACVVACGSSTSNTGTISGPVEGVTLSVADVASFAGGVPSTCHADYSYPYAVGVTLADQPGQCAREQSNQVLHGMTFLALGISSQTPIGPGTYTISTPDTAPPVASDVAATFELENAASQPGRLLHGRVRVAGVQREHHADDGQRQFARGLLRIDLRQPRSDNRDGHVQQRGLCAHQRGAVLASV